MFSSMITKNLNWENLTKNSVTFKRWDGVKDGVNIMGVRWFLGGGGVTKIQKYWADYFKWGRAGTVCRFKRGLAKKRGWCFWRGLIPKCTQSYRNQSIDLLSALIDWFLYDRELRHERGKDVIRKLP